MNRERLTDSYFVAPQIEVEDIKKIADAGFVKIICNRPDEEVPSDLHSHVMKMAADAVGIEFEILPLTHFTMNPENITKQFEMVAQANGPVLAYCASGTRCTIIWALSEAGKTEADDIIRTAMKAGYDIEAMRPALR
ncbi:MAG: TIGR01244 family sulfur transferase [Paracoccaceae bacterium]|jgi:uncharacterized protein (TIGR01244 family)|nr:TIGR01244 family sulfur transferase [Paracoccaceae bacterium]